MSEPYDNPSLCLPKKNWLYYCMLCFHFIFFDYIMAVNSSRLSLNTKFPLAPMGVPALCTLDPPLSTHRPQWKFFGARVW